MANRVVEELPGGGIWWPDSGYLWAEKGQCALPRAHSREDAQGLIDRFNDGEYFCVGCKTWYPKPAALDRFAGRYCEPCGEVYKLRHARICRLCRRPEWDCYC